MILKGLKSAHALSIHFEAVDWQQYGGEWFFFPLSTITNKQLMIMTLPLQDYYKKSTWTSKR